MPETCPPPPAAPAAPRRRKDQVFAACGGSLHLRGLQSLSILGWPPGRSPPRCGVFPPETGRGVITYVCSRSGQPASKRPRACVPTAVGWGEPSTAFTGLGAPCEGGPREPRLGWISNWKRQRLEVIGGADVTVLPRGPPPPARTQTRDQRHTFSPLSFPLYPPPRKTQTQAPTARARGEGTRGCLR